MFTSPPCSVHAWSAQALTANALSSIHLLGAWGGRSIDVAWQRWRRLSLKFSLSQKTCGRSGATLQEIGHRPDRATGCRKAAQENAVWPIWTAQ